MLCAESHPGMIAIPPAGPPAIRFHRRPPELTEKCRPAAHRLSVDSECRHGRYQINDWKSKFENKRRTLWLLPTSAYPVVMVFIIGRQSLSGIA
jgi:hypothetical protein